MIDLGSWLSGRYAIPVQVDDNDDSIDPEGDRDGKDSISRDEW